MNAGHYKVINEKLNIRQEPRVLLSNVAGQLSFGDIRQVYETITDDSNNIWGRISEENNAGKALWICMSNLNRRFVEEVEATNKSTNTKKIKLIVDDVVVYES